MVLQHAQSSFRIPWNKLEPARIVATAGALALNIVILLLLLVPAARLVPQIVETDTPWVPVLPKEKIPEPPPIIDKVPVVKPHTVTTAPTIKREVIDPQPQPDTEIVMPTGDLPATVPTVATATTPGPTLDGPVMGVQLEYLSAPPPKYPRDDLIARREGTVMLQVLVGIDGKPLEVNIQRSSGTRSLDEAARRFVLKNWTFRPAMRDGKPVQAIGLVPIDFRLG
jgi:protein TonB